MEPPEFVRRLAPDPALARQASFALFTLTYLEQAELAPSGAPRIGTLGAEELIAGLPAAVAAVLAQNPHLLAYFEDPAYLERLAQVDPTAARDLAAWARAQHLEREEAQVAYELALLALGIELPPVLVRSLRELEVPPGTRIAELPDGAGYPTVFLATLHPEWDAAAGTRLFVQSVIARQLAGWAMLLLTRSLIPPAGGIVPVTLIPDSPAALLTDEVFDVALVYNPVPALGTFDTWRQRLRARRFVVV